SPTRGSARSTDIRTRPSLPSAQKLPAVNRLSGGTNDSIIESALRKVVLPATIFKTQGQIQPVGLKESTISPLSVLPPKRMDRTRANHKLQFTTVNRSTLQDANLISTHVQFGRHCWEAQITLQL